MGVNRHTVREALKVLEYMGVVEGKTGVGTVIKNVGQQVLVDRISHAANFSPRRFLFELMELRKALEPSIAALAAERATGDDLEIMHRAMEDFKEEFEYDTLGSDADERLHVALAHATHNSTFVILTQPIMSMLSQYQETGLKMKGRRIRTYQEHERIYAAIKNRHPEAARSAMMDHLVQVEEMLNRIEDNRSPRSDACENDSFATIERED
jgi:GntR family transcriptional repressor for pyruvate dehydrogenase complex